MTWLVLAAEGDDCAGWVADGLADAGLDPLCVVADTELAGATWTHRIDGDATTTRVDLSDGRSIDSSDIRGTFNRLTYLPPAIADSLAADDQLYGLQEISALMMSWLASLPGPTVNPPDTRGFCGAWRSSGEWALLAGQAGLRCAPVYFDSASDGPGPGRGWRDSGAYVPFAEDVIVVGDAVFSRDDLDPDDIGACRRLAALASTPVLGIAFAADGTHEVAGITPLPDLRSGGDAVITAIADALGGGRGGP